VREKYRVKIARQAETDLAEIWTYIATDSVDNANQFILKLERRMKTLGSSPRRCPLISKNELLGTQYRHLLVRKYRTVFRISDDTVYILRIIHGARLLDTSLIED
jgi:toxin ParE1/3/4